MSEPKLICQAEILHVDGTAQPLHGAIADTAADAMCGMRERFRLPLKTGAVMTAREGSESGKIVLVGVVVGTKPLCVSIFGHDFMETGGVRYDASNIDDAPRHVGLPGRPEGDRKWHSYLSNRMDDQPETLFNAYLGNAHLKPLLAPFVTSLARRMCSILPGLDVSRDNGVLASIYGGARGADLARENCLIAAERVISLCDEIDAHPREMGHSFLRGLSPFKENDYLFHVYWAGDGELQSTLGQALKSVNKMMSGAWLCLFSFGYSGEGEKMIFGMSDVSWYLSTGKAPKLLGNSAPEDVSGMIRSAVGLQDLAYAALWRKVLKD